MGDRVESHGNTHGTSTASVKICPAAEIREFKETTLV